ncbi:hypothetical protein AVEN_138261-1 [Araneus ventricosus]|uniref:Uncharacterized protein n=1 Tax=Araneus ventricosus TaxID=182803 RepID=A0A4Y2WUR2_ARAVE|nr:hypothetical protein AVEN_236527-1 [Araneus ventricosus]GBO40536.1 hypothetical protein AVEN_138261-1 [Araneus ventricosus]
MSVILTNSLRKPISCCVYVTGSTNLTTRVKSVCEKRLWGVIAIKKCVNCQFELQKWKVVPWRRKTTRGLFWDGPRHFEPRSDDEDDTWAGRPSPSFHATPAGGRLTTMYDFACKRPHTQQIFSGIGFRAWNPPAPRPRPYH